MSRGTLLGEISINSPDSIFPSSLSEIVSNGSLDRSEFAILATTNSPFLSFELSSLAWEEKSLPTKEPRVRSTGPIASLKH